MMHNLKEWKPCKQKTKRRKKVEERDKRERNDEK